MYLRKVQFEQWHHPQFYPTATNPRIVTQPNCDDRQAAVLFNMLQVARTLAAHSSAPAPPINLDISHLPRPSFIHIITTSHSRAPFTKQRFDGFVDNFLDDLLGDSLDDLCHSSRPLLTPFSEIPGKRKQIIMSAIS